MSNLLTAISYRLHSGKNNKFLYYSRAYLRAFTPAFIHRLIGRYRMKELTQVTDIEYIQKRVDYYCQLADVTPLPPQTKRLCDYGIPKHQKVYYFDSEEIIRFFPKHLRWELLPGDIIHVPDIPSITKSRPLCEHNENSVLMKLDQIRHFIFVDDKKAFRDKLPSAIFRGKVHGKKSRRRFMEMYFGTPLCDCGDVGKEANPQWLTAKKTIREHLDYRYIMALEGNDVASNLKWVMSSNSIAVMPRPTCETWFMEGTLIPNYHYIEIQPDFSDLAEKMAYYNEHLEEAEAIIRHAHEYVQQFQDPRRETLIRIAVMQKYFQMTGQQI